MRTQIPGGTIFMNLTITKSTPRNSGAMRRADRATAALSKVAAEWRMTAVLLTVHATPPTYFAPKWLFFHRRFSDRLTEMREIMFAQLDCSGKRETTAESITATNHLISQDFTVVYLAQSKAKIDEIQVKILEKIWQK
ncbi:hypothetical protein CBL_12422 [Carabus blaptoides fortunei]